MNLEFGPWLKKRRRLLDLTQDDLATRAFCSVNTVRKIEAGDLTPSKDLSLAIAAALEIPVASRTEFVRFARNGATVPENAFSATPPTPLAPAALHASPPTVVAPGLRFQTPAPLTGAIGRDHETSVAIRILRLPGTRLMTLTGPPGTGKTRLAIEVATQLQDEYQQGAAFVPLAPVSQPALVETAIAQTLGVGTGGQTTIAQALRAFLRDKELLLVLDNFEHLLDAAPGITELLQHAPRLKIMTTSRERLRLYGERELAVDPLAVPRLSSIRMWNEFENYAAVQLFVERAQAVKPHFELNKENAYAIAQLCVELDGLPLALEMAASRVKWESPQALLPQLSRRLETLKGRARELDARQQTLRGAMDWSYDLLAEDERRVLRDLGVFRGGWTMEAANAVSGFGVGEILENLCEKSLVKQEQDAQGHTRYSLLEMIREYALEKLNAAGRAQAAHESHWDYFYALAQTMGTNMVRIESDDAFAQLKREQENVRAALEWSLMMGQNEKALNLAAALVPFWYHSSALREAIHWLEPILAMPIRADTDLLIARAHASNIYADFLRINGDMRRARIMSEQAIADWEQVGERGRVHLAFALNGLARTAAWQGDPDNSIRLARQALGMYQELGDTLGEANSWRRIGEWAMSRGDYPYARECLDRAIVLVADSGNLFARAVSFLERGDVSRAEGDLAAARHFYELGEQVNAGAPEFFLDMRFLQHFGILCALEGDPTTGQRLLARAARRAILQNTRFNLVNVFCGLAYCAAMQDCAQEAMRWIGVMDNMLEGFDAILPALDRAEYSRILARVQDLATPEQLARWRQEGRNLSLEDAVQFLPEG